MLTLVHRAKGKMGKQKKTRAETRICSPRCVLFKPRDSTTTKQTHRTKREQNRNTETLRFIHSVSFTFYDEPANDVVIVEDEEEANGTRAAPNGMGREVPRRAPEAVGTVRGGDSRPFHQGATLAGHLRHRRRGRTRLRQSCTCHARLTCTHELRLR